MFDRFYQVYDGSNYFIAYNEKKIANDNIKAIVESPIFLFISAFAYFFASWCCGITIKFHVMLFVPVLIIAVSYIAYRQVIPYIRLSFSRVRVFSLIYYAVVFLSVGFTEACRRPEKLSVVIALGIFIISTVYLDYFLRMFFYKISLATVFILIDIVIKRNRVVLEDTVMLVFTIVISSICYYVVMRSLTDNSEVTRDLEKKSKADLLTGLLNKQSFEERSKEYIMARSPKAKATLFVFDFDDFKYVNEDHGHQIGDEALKRFGSILREYFHPSDVLGRVGGDKFMVLVMGEMPESFIEKRCKNILSDLKKMRIEDAEDFSCSIGICEDNNSRSYDELKEIAGRALFEAKERGKGCYIVKHG